jgi:hypothetical protein
VLRLDHLYTGNRYENSQRLPGTGGGGARDGGDGADDYHDSLEQLIVLHSLFQQRYDSEPVIRASAKQWRRGSVDWGERAAVAEAALQW